MFVIFSVFYILVAAAMTVLILMQRGEGANAGASFGGGSSGTMFGARGSASFMGRMTYGLFALFIIMSLGMAIYLTHTGGPQPSAGLGVMAGVGTTTSQQPAATTGQAAQGQKPAAPVQQPATAVPRATQPATTAEKPAKPQAATGSDIPAATQSAQKGAKAGAAPAGHKDGTTGSGNN